MEITGRFLNSAMENFLFTSSSPGSSTSVLEAWAGYDGILLCSKNEESRKKQEDSRQLDRIRNAQNGDKDSFETLIRQYLPFITEDIARFCPRSTVEDVAQEVLIRAWQALPRYSETGAFRWWLRKITTRACLDYWRGTRRSEKIRQAYSAEVGNDPRTPDETLLCDLDRFMEQLSAEDRMVFVLAYLEDLPHSEIATLLGITVVAAKVRCFRMRKRVREWLAL